MADKAHLKALVCLAIIGVLFYWKFLLTHQYSILCGYEGVNQAYSWYNFIASSIKAGDWPTWDPNVYSGRAFAGEMQTAAFYPLYRNHSCKGTPPQEPWRFGEPWLSLARETLERRYRLLPALFLMPGRRKTI